MPAQWGGGDLQGRMSSDQLVSHVWPQSFPMKVLRVHRSNLSYWLAVSVKDRKRGGGAAMLTSCQSDQVPATFNSAPHLAGLASCREKKIKGERTKSMETVRKGQWRLPGVRQGPFWVASAQSIEPTASSDVPDCDCHCQSTVSVRVPFLKYSETILIIMTLKLALFIAFITCWTLSWPCNRCSRLALLINIHRDEPWDVDRLTNLVSWQTLRGPDWDLNPLWLAETLHSHIWPPRQGIAY